MTHPHFDPSLAPLIFALCVAVVVAIAWASRAAEREPAPCRYCHPIECLTSAFCGHGCSCLMLNGESAGRCVPQ